MQKKHLILCLLIIFLMSMLIGGIVIKDNHFISYAEQAITFTPVSSTYVYDGKEKSFNFTAKIGSSDAPTYSYEVRYNGSLVKPVNAGTYDVAITATSDYSGSYNGTFTIEKRELTINDSNIQVSSKTYNGDNATSIVSGSFTFTGKANENDDINVFAEAQFDNKNAGDNKTLTITYGIEGTLINNYKLNKSTKVMTANISPYTLVLSSNVNLILSSASKVYDGSNIQEIACEMQSFPALDRNIVKAYIKLTYPNKDAMKYQGTQVSLILKKNDADMPAEELNNYVLPTNYSTTTDDAEILKKKLTILSSALTYSKEKIYDKSPIIENVSINGTANGIIDGDIISVTPNATFSDLKAGNDKLLTISFILGGEDKNNYLSPDNITDLGNILRRKIIFENEELETIKPWDNTLIAKIIENGTIANLCNDDVVVVHTNAVFSSSDIGTNKTITVSYSLSGTNNDNYIAPDGKTIENAVIKKRPLKFVNNFITAKIYDGTNSTKIINNSNASLQTDCLIEGYTNVSLRILSSYYDGIDSSKTRIIYLNFEVYGTNSNYYDVPESNSINGIIDPIQLTRNGSETPVQTEKVYDGTTNAVISDLGSFNETILPADVTKFTWNATAYFNSSYVGTNKIITFSYSSSGEKAVNYKLPENIIVNNCKITPYVIKVNISNTTHVYGNVGEISYNAVKPDNTSLPVNLIPEFRVSYKVNGIYRSDKPQDIGTYAVVVTLIDKNNIINYVMEDESLSVEVPFIITRATAEVHFQGETGNNFEYRVTFDENGFNETLLFNKITVSPLNVNYKVTYYQDADGLVPLVDGSSNPIIPYNAGQYYFKVKIESDVNYLGVETTTRSIVIEKKNITSMALINLEQCANSFKPIEVITIPDGCDYVIEYKTNEGAYTETAPVSLVSGFTYQVRVTINDINYSGLLEKYITVNDQLININLTPLNNTIVLESGIYVITYNSGATSETYKFNAESSDSGVDNNRIIVTYINVLNNESTSTAPINAGSYIVKASYDYNGQTGNEEIRFNIKKQDASITFTNRTSIYDGKSKAVGFTTNPENLKTKVKYIKDGREYTNVVNAGVYIVTVIIDENNYQGESTSDYTISPYKCYIVLSDSTTAFSNNAFDPETITLAKDSQGNTLSSDNIAYDNIIYEYQNGDYITTNAPVFAGTYTVRANFKDLNNYDTAGFSSDTEAQLIIEEAEISIEIKSYQDSNGNTLTNTIVMPYSEANIITMLSEDFTFKNQNGIIMNIPFTDNVKFEYYLRNELNELVSVNPKNVGVYEVKIILDVLVNGYARKEFNAFLKIEPKILNLDDGIIITDKEFSWGDNLEHNLKIATTPEGLPYLISYFVQEGENRIKIDDLSRLNIPGNYIGVVTINDPNNNYLGTAEDIMVVKKMTAGIDITISNTKVSSYGNVTPASCYVTIDNGKPISNTDITITLEYYLNNKLLTSEPNNAGDYRVRALINSQFYEGEKTVDYKIAKKPLTVIASDLAVNYTGYYPDIIINYIGLIEGDTADSIFAEKPSLITNFKDVGVHDLELSNGILKYSNYEITTVIGKLTINKVLLSISLKSGLRLLQGQRFIAKNSDFLFTGLLGEDTSNAVNNLNVRVKKDGIYYSDTTKLQPGIYDLEIYGATSFNYNIEYDQLAKLEVYNNNIYDDNKNIEISGGEFQAGTKVSWSQIIIDSDVFKNYKKSARKSLYGTNVIDMYSLSVLYNNSAISNGSYKIRFKVPDNITLDKNSNIVYLCNGVSQNLDYEIDNEGYIIANVNNLNCVIIFSQKKDYTWLYIVLGSVLFIGVVTIIVMIVIKKKKELPEELDEKGDVISAIPDEENEKKIEEDEFNDLIKKAEEGKLETIVESKPEPLFYQSEKKGNKNQSVTDRLMEMATNNLKDKFESEKEKNKENEQPKEEKEIKDKVIISDRLKQDIDDEIGIDLQNIQNKENKDDKENDKDNKNN